MTKTILITGATDGIGLETAKVLVGLGHKVLIHGRNEVKLANTQAILSEINAGGVVEAYRADLSKLADVEELAAAVIAKTPILDVLINNAGVFKLAASQEASGFDLRFMVNTVAPFLLTKRLLHLLPANGRVINLSSAAQAPVNINGLLGKVQMNDNEAYAQSKLALTMWSFQLAHSLGANGPAIIATNPGSFLGSKMVKEAYGVEGKDISVGSDILVRAALSDEFADASGKYFDNDSHQFAMPHTDALDRDKNAKLVEALEIVLSEAE